MDKNVLIIRLSSLGDVVFNLPLAAVLKANGYKVTWVTSEKGFDIIKNNPLIDEAILAPVEKWKKQKFLKNFKEYLSILKHLRTKHYDVAIDTQQLIKSFIWMFPCKAKRKLVSDTAREFSFLGGNEILKLKSAKCFDIHIIEHYLEYARHLNLDTKSFQVALPPSTEETINKIDSLLKGLDKTKPIITIAPATTWVPKHWNKDYWKEVVTKLGRNYNIIFTGTSKDIELINYISEEKHLNLAGKTNLLELIELLRRTDLLISLDSGSTHLAWATGHPKIISLYFATPPTRYAPLGSEDKYIALSGNLACQHCHKRTCPLKTNECTFYPKPEEVLNAVDKLLPLNII